MHVNKYLILLGLLYLSPHTIADSLKDNYGLTVNSNHTISLFSESDKKPTQINNSISQKNQSSNLFAANSSLSLNTSALNDTWTISSTEMQHHCIRWEGEMIPDQPTPKPELFATQSQSTPQIAVPEQAKNEGTTENFNMMDDNRCVEWFSRPEHTYGTASVYRSSDNILDKVVVIVQPYIITLNDSIYSADQFYDALNSGNLLGSLRGAGYDVILYRYNNQDSGIVYNAKGVKRLLNEINEQPNVSSTSVIGLSMGGVVARHALADLENQGQLNKVATYVSFDAPHLGANFPKAVIDNIDGLLDKVDSLGCGEKDSCRRDRRELKAIISKLNTQTFKELIFTLNKTEHHTLLQALQQIGHVNSIPTLAVTNGAQNQSQGYPQIKLTTHFKLHRKWYNGGSKYFKVYTVPSLDNVAGGYSDFYQLFSSNIAGRSHPITPYVTLGQRHSFVSTTSALAGSASHFTEVASYPASNEPHLHLSYSKAVKIRQWLDEHQF